MTASYFSRPKKLNPQRMKKVMQQYINKYNRTLYLQPDFQQQAEINKIKMYRVVV